jgi:hypothetical protein
MTDEGIISLSFSAWRTLIVKEKSDYMYLQSQRHNQALLPSSTSHDSRSAETINVRIGGYYKYKYRCKYWLTSNCENWIWINNDLRANHWGYAFGLSLPLLFTENEISETMTTGKVGAPQNLVKQEYELKPHIVATWYNLRPGSDVLQAPERASWQDIYLRHSERGM